MKRAPFALAGRVLLPLWLAVWAAGVPCARAYAYSPGPPRAALVVTSSEPASPALLDAYRARYAQGPPAVEWLPDPEVREVLEHPGGVPSAEERVRASLDAATTAIHHFDLSACEKELENTFARAQHLLPTREGRDLYVQATLVAAEAAVIRKDEGASRTAFALALSIQPQLTLDPREHSPQLREAFLSARRWLRGLPRVSFTLASDVPGTHVVYGGVDRGPVPVKLEDVPATLQVVWLSAGGMAPSALQVRPAPDQVLKVSLSSRSLASRAQPLARALLDAASPSAQQAAAQRLAVELRTPLVALVADFSQPPRWLGPFELPPLVPLGLGLGPGPGPARTLPRHGVPAYVLGGVAVGVAGAGVLLGELARRDETSAKTQHFGSEGARINQQAQREAIGANAAYAGAGAAFLVGAGFFFLF